MYRIWSDRRSGSTARGSVDGCILFLKRWHRDDDVMMMKILEEFGCGFIRTDIYLWDHCKHEWLCTKKPHIFNSLVTQCGSYRHPDVKNVCRGWYGTQGLRAVMWKSRGCEGGATLLLPSVGDKSCARGWLLVDRLDVKHAQVSQASQGHRLGGFPAQLLLETEVTPTASTQHTSLLDIQVSLSSKVMTRWKKALSWTKEHYKCFIKKNG